MQDDLSRFAGQAAVAVSVLKSIAHEGRLLVLCYLSEAGELSAFVRPHQPPRNDSGVV